MGKEFTEGYVSTIGVDFEMKQATIQDKKVNLQIWDTAGQERFRTITTSYYRSCDSILIVFDISDKSTFGNLDAWLEDVRSYARKDVNMILVGNKVDLYEFRQVPFETAKAFADACGMGYIETSAKTDFNVAKAFDSVASVACQRRLQEGGNERKDSQDTLGYGIHVEEKGSKRGCCG